MITFNPDAWVLPIRQDSNAPSKEEVCFLFPIREHMIRCEPDACEVIPMHPQLRGTIFLLKLYDHISSRCLDIKSNNIPMHPQN